MTKPCRLCGRDLPSWIGRCPTCGAKPLALTALAIAVAAELARRSFELRTRTALPFPAPPCVPYALLPARATHVMYQRAGSCMPCNGCGHLFAGDHSKPRGGKCPACGAPRWPAPELASPPPRPRARRRPSPPPVSRGFAPGAAALLGLEQES